MRRHLGQFLALLAVALLAVPCFADSGSRSNARNSVRAPSAARFKQNRFAKPMVKATSTVVYGGEMLDPVTDAYWFAGPGRKAQPKAMKSRTVRSQPVVVYGGEMLDPVTDAYWFGGPTK
jgi:hypothetical protein